MGKKVLATHRYEGGKMHEITVLHCENLKVIQKILKEKNGYSALQVAYGDKKQRNKAIVGHFGDNLAKGNLVEFRTNNDIDVNELSLDVLDGVITINATSYSKGKGFAGPVKRWGFRTQDATHGNSLSHRAHGSTGQCQDPGRVFKGKKMAGRMGHTRVTIKNLKIFKIDKENNLLYIVGSVPGSIGTYVKVLPHKLASDGEK